jgi:hypothetical protein
VPGGAISYYEEKNISSHTPGPGVANAHTSNIEPKNASLTNEFDMIV